MPLRDHLRPPLSDARSWEELHGCWPMMIARATCTRGRGGSDRTAAGWPWSTSSGCSPSDGQVTAWTPSRPWTLRCANTAGPG